MKTLHPNNRNPKELHYDEVYSLLIESYNEGQGFQVGVGNNTVASIYGEEDSAIQITLHRTVVAELLDRDTVRLNTGGFLTSTTKQRLDWCALPLGFRIAADGNIGKGRVRWGENHSRFSVYSIATGAYRDFTEGMILERGAF